MENISKKMAVRIKKNAYCWANNSDKLRKFLQSKEGEWIEVETDCLFTNQYNTKEFRIYDSMISEVKNDARQGMGKCKYCGAMLKSGEVCMKYTKENHSQIGNNPARTCADYGIEWFTPENTYFLKYPKGCAAQPKKEILSIHDQGRERIGSYYLENYPSLDYYRLYNCRQTINFKFDGKVFFIHNGIGYYEAKRLPIPANLDKKLLKRLSEYQSLA